MKIIFCFLGLWFILKIASGQNQQFPDAEISNGIITVKLLMPDKSNGYYRGTRFDWSGVISSLKYSGHEYFGKWFDKYEPTIHDAIMGPVDDFQPVGFEEAKPGESFLKIGIGVVTKPDEKPYTIVRYYPIVSSGTWKIKGKPDQVTYIHRLKDVNYAYAYEKTIQLLKDKPVLEISHTFKNTGKKVIETTCYNHNFFVIDGQPTGPGYFAVFPFKISGVFRDHPELVDISGNSFTLKRNLTDGEYIFSSGLQGTEKEDKVYEVKVENRATGAGVKITCNRPLLKMVFWANPRTFCPEPYIILKAKPGELFSWTIRYEFYTL